MRPTQVRSPSPSPPEHFEQFAFVGLIPDPGAQAHDAPNGSPTPAATHCQHAETHASVATWCRSSCHGAKRCWPCARATLRQERHPCVPWDVVKPSSFLGLFSMTASSRYALACLNPCIWVEEQYKKKDLVYIEVLVWCNSCLRLLCSMFFFDPRNSECSAEKTLVFCS